MFFKVSIPFDNLISDHLSSHKPDSAGGHRLDLFLSTVISVILFI